MKFVDALQFVAALVLSMAGILNASKVKVDCISRYSPVANGQSSCQASGSSVVYHCLTRNCSSQSARDSSNSPVGEGSRCIPSEASGEELYTNLDCVSYEYDSDRKLHCKTDDKQVGICEGLKVHISCTNCSP